MNSGRYAKLRDRIAYEKAGRGDWTPKQIASAEAVLASWPEAGSEADGGAGLRAEAFDIMQHPDSPDFIARCNDFVRRAKANLRKRKADLQGRKGPSSFTPSVPSLKASELAPASKPKTAKAVLTDRKLKSLKPAPDGKPYFVWDVTVPGFCLRVLGKPGAPVKSLGIMKRFPGSAHPSFWAFGRYDAMSLQEGRDKARVSLAQIAKGIDPRLAEERQRRAAIEAECAKQASTVEAVLDAYFEVKAGLRTIGEIKRELRREFRDWLSLPITDITRDRVKRTVKAIIPRGREQARASFRRLRAFLDWAVESGDYGLEVSPCAGIKTTALIGDSVPSRELRDLTDVEIAAFWRAASALGYPLGPYFKLVLLTACRRNEVANAEWREFDFKEKLWTIPAKRMKGKAAKAHPHDIPLTPDILALLGTLPRFAGGDFLFSSTGRAQGDQRLYNGKAAARRGHARGP